MESNKNRNLSIIDPQSAGTSGSAAVAQEDIEMDDLDDDELLNYALVVSLEDVEMIEAPPVASSAPLAPLAQQEFFGSPSTQEDAPPGRMSRARSNPPNSLAYQPPEAVEINGEHRPPPRPPTPRPPTPNRAPPARRLAKSIRLDEERELALQALNAPIPPPEQLIDGHLYGSDMIEVFIGRPETRPIRPTRSTRPTRPRASTPVPQIQPPKPKKKKEEKSHPAPIVEEAPDSDDSDTVPSAKKLCCCYCCTMCSLSGLTRGCPPTDTGKSCIGCWCCCCTCICNPPVNAAPVEKEDEPEKEPQEEPEVEEPLIPEEPPPTPPTMEEVLAWANSFDDVMRSSAGRKIFRDFLRGEYSEENIMFWLACEDLKRETEKDVIIQKSRFIYEDYISVLSPKEVSLDSAVREIVNMNMMEPTANCFDEAQLQIYTLMRRDSYPRFVNSALYKTLVSLYDGPNKNTSK